MRKMDKTRKHSNAAIFVWDENSHQQLLDAQNINTERVPLSQFTDV